MAFAQETRSEGVKENDLRLAPGKLLVEGMRVLIPRHRPSVVVFIRVNHPALAVVFHVKPLVILLPTE